MMLLSFMQFKLRFKIVLYVSIFFVGILIFLFVSQRKAQAGTKCILPGSAGCSTYSYEGLVRWPGDCRPGSQRAVRVNIGRQYGSVCHDCSDGSCKIGGRSGRSPTKHVSTFYRDGSFNSGEGWAFVGVWIAGADYEGNMYYWLYRGWAGNGISDPQQGGGKIAGVTTSGNGKSCPGGDYGVNFSRQKCGGSGSTCFLKSEEKSKCGGSWFYRNPWDGYGHICEYFNDPMSSCNAAGTVCGLSRNKWQRSIWDAQSLIVGSVWHGLDVNTYGVWFSGGHRKRWYAIQGTAYELYCQIPNQGPSVSSNLPCYDSPSTQITADYTDDQGWSDLDRVGIKVSGNNYNSQLCGTPSGGTIVPQADCSGKIGNISVQSMNVINDNKTLRVIYNVGGIPDATSQLEVRLYARDKGGEIVNWQLMGNMYMNPDVVQTGWDKDPLIAGDTANFTWRVNNASSCTVALSGQCWGPGGCTNCGVTCGSGDLRSLQATMGTTVPATCRATLNASNSGCTDQGAATADIISPSWLMTEYGDTFASQGYDDMEIWETQGPLSGVYPPPNYFSRYIISSGNATLTANNESRKSYKLSSYDDQNVEKRLFYSFLEGLVNTSITPLNPSSGWSDTGDGVYEYIGASETLNIAGGICNKKAVIFVEGNLNLIPPFSIVGNDHGCLFIVGGDITINGVGDVAGFFVTNRNFTTAGNGTLIIKGGVITNIGSFDCEGGGNPGEIIDYDPRYLYILKEYLGEDYPYKIREWKYSAM